MTGRRTPAAIGSTRLGRLGRPARPGGATIVARSAFANLIGRFGPRHIGNGLLR